MPNLLAILRETFRSIKMGGNSVSKLTMAVDVLGSRLLRFYKFGWYNCIRTVKLNNGILLNYRFNRGDVQGIREIWIDQCYEIPVKLQPSVIVDLGGNIGLTSIWLKWRYNCDQIIIVEPNPNNVAVIKANLISNGFKADIFEAVVGPIDGETYFVNTDESNLGHVRRDGENTGAHALLVPMVSMKTVFNRIGEGRRINLLKIDIEGGESALFDGDLSWLQRVDLIIAELHPHLADCERVVSRILEANFVQIQCEKLTSNCLSAFIHRDLPASSISSEN